MAETVLTLHESPVSPIVLQEALRELVIEASAPLTLTLIAPEQTTCSLVVRIRRAAEPDDSGAGGSGQSAHALVLE